MDAAIRIDDDTVRRWVANLRRPDRLGDPALAALLRAHGRMPDGGGLRIGRAGADLLREKIDSLRPGDGAPASEAVPHRVLTACFVEGRKSFQAAALLGLSERQISRERSRAIGLLAAELRSVPLVAGRSPVPPRELLPRPALVDRLDAALASGHVHVTGGAGAGKTALVDSWSQRSDKRVFRHAFAPALGEGLGGLLLALGEDLAPGDPTLRNYMRAALPRPDLALAARIAFAALQREPRVLVLDDYDAAAPPVEAFVAALAHLSPVRVVTIARRNRTGAASLTVPPLAADEIAALLRLRGADGASARRLHAWLGGNARLVDAAAGWLSRSGPGRDALLHAAAGDAAATAARLMWSARGRAA